MVDSRETTLQHWLPVNNAMGTLGAVLIGLAPPASQKQNQSTVRSVEVTFVPTVFQNARVAPNNIVRNVSLHIQPASHARNDNAAKAYQIARYVKSALALGAPKHVLNAKQLQFVRIVLQYATHVKTIRARIVFQQHPNATHATIFCVVNHYVNVLIVPRKYVQIVISYVLDATVHSATTFNSMNLEKTMMTTIARVFHVDMDTKVDSNQMHCIAKNVSILAIFYLNIMQS
jgi:hypothetical protein